MTNSRNILLSNNVVPVCEDMGPERDSVFTKIQSSEHWERSRSILEEVHTITNLKVANITLV